MTHRKAYSYSESSEARVPFSWEERPGIPKFIHHQSNTKINAESSANSIQLILRRSSSSSHLLPSPSAVDVIVSRVYSMMKISPPPGIKVHSQPVPNRIPSWKGLWKQQRQQQQDDDGGGDDPFAVAIKKCTKSIRSSKNYKGHKESSHEKKMVFGSCKKSCDVEEDSLIKLVDLPPLPRGRKPAALKFS